jgi:hypothetical protein
MDLPPAMARALCTPFTIIRSVGTRFTSGAVPRTIWAMRSWPVLLFLVAAVCALSPALRNAGRLSVRYDFRYFDTMTEVARRTILWHHEAPLWNPYPCGGEVDLANPQSMEAAPTFLFVLLAGTAAGQKLALLLYYFLALLSAYHLARWLSLSPIAAALCALGYGLSGYLALHLGAGHVNFAGVALYPALLLFFDRALGEIEWLVPLALCAAWIALLGGTFTPPMAGVLLCLWAGERAVATRSLRPLGLLLLMVLLALLCSAVRMLPVLEFLRDHPRPPFRRGVTDVSHPLHLLSDLFAWRELEPVPGRKYWSHEYAARLPYVLAPLWLLSPLLLRGASPERRRLLRRLSLLLLFGVLLSMGNFLPVAPWSLLQRLPVFSDLRVPSRFLILVVLALALIAGLCWDAVAARLGPRARWLGPLLVLLCAVDGAAYTAAQFRGHFVAQVRTPPGPVPFYHVPGDWSTMREEVFAGRGVLRCDEEAPLQRAEALDEGEVPQERLLDPAAGEITAARFSPNRRVVTVDLQRDTLLLINSNWNEHFRADVDGKPGRVTRVAGRLAVDLAGLPPGRRVVTVRYAPRSFFIGAAVSAISLPAMLAWFVWRRRLRRQLGKFM